MSRRSNCCVLATLSTRAPGESRVWSAISAAGSRVQSLDVTKEADLERVVETIITEQGRIEDYTSTCEPMITVLSRGSPKYSAASAVIRDVARKSCFRQRAIVGSSPRRSSIFDRK
jgi:hypothetical protein